MTRAAVESESEMRAALAAEQTRSTRLRAALRYVSSLVDRHSERELLEGALHAAALWFDVDAAVYRRNLAGEYARFASLPGGNREHQPELLQSAVGRYREPTILTAADLGEIGWPTSASDLLVVPIIVGGESLWLLVLVGAANGDAAAVFGAVGAAFASAFDRIAQMRTRDLATRLSQGLIASASPSAAASFLVHEIARTLGASQARLLVRRGETAETIAVAGDAEAGARQTVEDWESSVASAGRLELPLQGSANAVGRLILVAPAQAPFYPGVLPIVNAAATVSGVWLGASRGGGGTAVSEPASFERQLEAELQRAKETRREFALLLVEIGSGAREQQNLGILIEALRPELRGSDLVGLLGTREVAALLAHVTPATATAVAKRVQKRLAEMARKERLQSVLLGQAAFPSGGESLDALVERARAQAAPLLRSS